MAGDRPRYWGIPVVSVREWPRGGLLSARCVCSAGAVIAAAASVFASTFSGGPKK